MSVARMHAYAMDPEPCQGLVSVPAIQGQLRVNRSRCDMNSNTRGTPVTEPAWPRPMQRSWHAHICI